MDANYSHTADVKRLEEKDNIFQLAVNSSVLMNVYQYNSATGFFLYIKVFMACFEQCCKCEA